MTNITGENEHSMEMHMLLPFFDIFVMTPKILENHMLRGYIKDLGVFSLIVFDECHHTREDEPYNTLMLSYIKKKNDPSVSLPQVLYSIYITHFIILYFCVGLKILYFSYL